MGLPARAAMHHYSVEVLINKDTIWCVNGKHYPLTTTTVYKIKANTVKEEAKLL